MTGVAFEKRPATLDVRLLCDWFAIQVTPHAPAQLYTTASDDCRKFHVDNHRVRLVCTYAGPGTEVVPSAFVNREHLCATDGGPDRVNALIVPDPQRVVRCQAGDAIVMKGQRYHGGRREGAVHRSPPVSGTGLTRLVLVITAP